MIDWGRSSTCACRSPLLTFGTRYAWGPGPAVGLRASVLGADEPMLLTGLEVEEAFGSRRDRGLLRAAAFGGPAWSFEGAQVAWDNSWRETHRAWAYGGELRLTPRLAAGRSHTRALIAFGWTTLREQRERPEWSRRTLHSGWRLRLGLTW